MLKKLICSLALVAMVGCGTGESANKITIWHWMTDRHQAFEQLALKYQEQTGVEVEFKKFFPPDIYSTKVIAAARAGTLPEVFGILGEKKVLASFATAGHVADLTPEFAKDGWGDSLYKQTMAVTAFGEENFYKAPKGSYGVPLDSSSMQFVYNKDLFKQAGLDPEQAPKTFTDLIEMAKIVKEKVEGVEGIVCGWGEVWLMHCLATEWAINIMGEDKFVDTLRGEVPYTDPQWIQVFDLFKQLKDSGVLYSDIVTMVNRESEDYFSRGKAVFSFDGSWAVNVYKQLAPELNYGFFPLPVVNKKNPAKIWGGAGASFTVNSKSKKKETAVDFLKWLTAKEQQSYLLKETNNLPSAKGLESELDSKLQSLLKGLESATHPNIWPVEEDSRVIEIMDKGLQQIVLGEKTPEEVATKIQNTKSRVSGK